MQIYVHSMQNTKLAIDSNAEICLYSVLQGAKTKAFNRREFSFIRLLITQSLLFPSCIYSPCQENLNGFKNEKGRGWERERRDGEKEGERAQGRESKA